jgi:hypothetical protein
VGQVLAIKRDEWLWVTGWSVIILLFINVPFVIGAFVSTPAYQYGGFVYGLEDGYSYLAKMQEGAAGFWFFYLAYSPEPHSGGPFFLMYLLLGKLARLFNASPILVLHISRSIAGAFTLVSFYAVSAFFLQSVAVRRASFLLFGLAAGLGWLWTLLAQPIGPGVMPVDLWVPESTFFLSALTFPHLTLSLALQLWCTIGILWYLDSGRWPAWLLAAGSGLLMTLIHPYKYVVILPVIGAYLLWQVVRQRYRFWLVTGRLVLVLLPTIPYLVYAVIVFSSNQAFVGWRLQNMTRSPLLHFYLLGFGLLLPLALIGVWRLRTDGDRVMHPLYLLLWLVVTPVLVYIPLTIQRRFLDGYQVVLALFAGFGAVWLLQQLSDRRRLVVSVIGLLLLSLTNIMLLIGAGSIVASRQPPHFHTGYELAGYRWLAENATPRQVVFASYPTGNVLPAYAPLNVFVGHGSETVRFSEKKALADRFFDQATTNDWRQTLLTDYRVDYLYYGPHEQAAGAFQPATVSYLSPVYSDGPVTIFRVTP